MTAELTSVVLESQELDDTSRSVLTAIGDLFSGSSTSNIEDYLSEIIDLLAIGERRVQRGASNQFLPLAAAQYTPGELRIAADSIKRAIATVMKKKTSIATHRAFAAAVH